MGDNRISTKLASLTLPFRRQPPSTPSVDALQESLVAIPSPARREQELVLTARAFAIALAVSLLVNLALAWTVATLIPLFRVEPYLVTFANDSRQIVHLQPFERTMKGFDAMTELLSRQYVIERHTVVADNTEMTRRWGPDGIIWKQSARDEYERFMKATKPTWDNLKSRHITRSIAIVSSSQISPGYWQVEFILKESENNIVTSREGYVATLRVDYEPSAVQGEDRFLNPLGFQVLDYTVAPRELNLDGKKNK